MVFLVFEIQHHAVDIPSQIGEGAAGGCVEAHASSEIAEEADVGVPGVRDLLPFCVFADEFEFQLAVDGGIVVRDGDVHAELISGDGFAEAVLVGFLHVAERLHLEHDFILCGQVFLVAPGDGVADDGVVMETLVDGRPFVHQAAVAAHVAILLVLVNLSSLFHKQSVLSSARDGV